MTFLDSLINGKTGPGCKTNVPWEELTFHPRGVGSQTEALDLGSDGLLSPLVDPQQTPGPTPNLSRATPDSEPGTQLMLTHQELSGRPAWGMCVSAGPRPPSTTAWGHTWLPGCPGACNSLWAGGGLQTGADSGFAPTSKGLSGGWGLVGVSGFPSLPPRVKCGSEVPDMGRCPGDTWASRTEWSVSNK